MKKDIPVGHHRAIAEKFVGELLETRHDILGVLLVGSVAHAEETAFSDIDLRVVLNDETATSQQRDGLDTWCDHIYIDAVPVPQSAYADLSTIFRNPISANDLDSGRIVYDPTGFLQQMQQATQAAFMAPKWVAARIHPLYRRIPQHLLRFQDAITTGDLRSLCIQTGRIVFGCAIIPLLHQGIAPSSTRHLRQLGQISASAKHRLCDFEGALHLSETDVLTLVPAFSTLSALGDTARWGHLPEYMIKKVAWMAQHGYHHEAIHALWINGSFRLQDCERQGDRQTLSEADRFVQEWLHAVKWFGEDWQTNKFRQITAIWEDTKASIADILEEISDEG